MPRLLFSSTAPIPNHQSRWQDLLIVEGSGLRTTLAACVPLIVGQVTGHPTIGMLAAVGGLQCAFADFQGAKARTMLWATIASAVFAFLGALLSQSHPAVSIAAMFLVAFGLTMLGAFGDVSANASFVLIITYAFAQGTPVSWHTGVEYLWTFLLGGIWATLLTLLLWRLRRTMGDGSVGQPAINSWTGEAPLVFKTPAEHLSSKSPVFKHACRVAVATAAGIAICQKWHPPHGYWIILTIMVILKPDYDSTKGRFAQRLVGTIVGGLLAMIPAATIHNVAALDALLVLFGILAFSHLPRNYGIYVVFLTPFVVLISTIAAPSESEVALARMSETILGGVLAFTIAFLLRSPKRYLAGGDA